MKVILLVLFGTLGIFLFLFAAFCQNVEAILLSALLLFSAPVLFLIPFGQASGKSEQEDAAQYRFNRHHRRSKGKGADPESAPPGGAIRGDTDAARPRDHGYELDEYAAVI
jgi:hypothetical protein